MNNFEKFLLSNLEKNTATKVNAIEQAIISKNYNLNTPRIEQKLAKATSELIKKHNLEDNEENQKLIADKILKQALEKIALDLGGQLSYEPKLESEYLEILYRQGLKSSAQDREEIIALVKDLDEKNILSSEKQGELIDRLILNLLANE